METKLQEPPDPKGKKKLCFVIMPFSQTDDPRADRRHTRQYWDWFFHEFIKRAIEPHGYIVSRSQDNTANITRNVMLDIALADLVVAVLTDKNPNVLWELGVRHFSRNGTICLIEKGTKRDFDLCVHGSLEYEDFQFDKFCKDVKRYIESAEQEISDSPVSDFLNIGPNFCVHYAASILQRAKTLIEKYLSETGKDEFGSSLKTLLDEFQSELNRKYNAQITVIDINPEKPKAKTLFHLDPELIGKDPDDPNRLFWKNVYKPNESYFNAMKVICRGIRLGYVELYEERLTAIAFDTLMKPKWLIVAEAHDPRLLRPMLKH